jgi:3-isopropylmalate/(R)-2-methylmalate dehydratase small subunit
MNIGVLPVQISPEFLDKIFKAIESDPNAEFKVDLSEQTFTILSTGESETFGINEYKKGNLLNGYDDIDYLLNLKDDIKTFAEARPF